LAKGPPHPPAPPIPPVARAEFNVWGTVFVAVAGSPEPPSTKVTMLVVPGAPGLPRSMIIVAPVAMVPAISEGTDSATRRRARDI
jgi:hypothetical protein